MVNKKISYLIIDNNFRFYRIGKSNKLVRAKNKNEAERFSYEEANNYIGSNDACKFTIIEVPDAEQGIDTDNAVSDYAESVEETDVKRNEMELDDLEELLSRLSYMSEHLGEYREDLNEALSDIDKEISDIEHYLELYELDDARLIEAAKMLQEKRRERRIIKNELEKATLVQTTFNREFRGKVNQSLSQIKTLGKRKYTPRRLTGLFSEGN